MRDNYCGIRLVSWDVDGTLFSYFRLAVELFRTHRFTLSELREAWDFYRSVEKQRRDVACAVIGEEMDRVQRIQSREKKALRRALCRISPRRRAVELITNFAASNIPQVALSDFECDYKLDALQLSRYFAQTYSCQEVGYWKPSPVALERIQRDFRITPSEHLHIGDREDTDGQACTRNGCRFMLIDPLPRLWRPFTLLCSLL